MKDSYLVWKSRDTRVGVLQESKREEAKIGKVEWQDMKDSYLYGNPAIPGSESFRKARERRQR